MDGQRDQQIRTRGGSFAGQRSVSDKPTMRPGASTNGESEGSSIPDHRWRLQWYH